MLPRGWTWRTLCEVKQASHKRTNTVGSHLQEEVPGAVESIATPTGNGDDGGYILRPKSPRCSFCFITFVRLQTVIPADCSECHQNAPQALNQRSNLSPPLNLPAWSAESLTPPSLKRSRPFFPRRPGSWSASHRLVPVAHSSPDP